MTGQQLIDELRGFLRSWVVFRHDYDPLVLALWVLNTYVYEHFDTCPYLCISGVTKQSGKTTTLECLAALSRHSELLTDPTQANLMRLADLEEYAGKISYFLDEAEKLSKENHDARPFINAGYRQGATVPRTMPGGAVRKFPCYYPKSFALIGDLYDTARDRCIVIRMQRSADVARRYRPSFMRQEARELVFKIRDYMERFNGGVQWASDDLVAHLDGRNEEIWLPLFSLAQAMSLNAATMHELTIASTDLSAEKTDEIRSYIELRATAEATQTEDDYARKALQSLRDVMAEAGTDRVWTAEAIELMKATPTAPWRTYKGSGLTPDGLATLLRRFRLEPKDVRRKGSKRDEKGAVRKGYYLKDVAAAVTDAGVK